MAFERVSRELAGAASPAPDYPALLASHSIASILVAASSVLEGRLLTRLRHTVTEAVRVEDAEQAMRAAMDRAREMARELG